MTLIELFSSSPAWFISSVVLLSLLIGSFLNVVIHRLPIMLDRDWRKQSEAFLASVSTTHNPQPTASYNLWLLH